MFSCSVEQPVIISNSTAVKSPVWEDRCSATVTPLCGWNPIHVNKVEKMSLIWKAPNLSDFFYSKLCCVKPFWMIL